jgi:Protein of unknown function (DUF2961)
MKARLAAWFMPVVGLLAALVGADDAASQGRRAQSADAAILDRVIRLDQLPRFKTIESIGMFSSYDRTGGNDDGFNGTHSFIRKEPGGLVIAEMKGPGAITRIWTPTPTDDVVEFYFDGERTPRIREKMNDLFNGTRFPFVAPLSGIGAGGFYTYVPIAYARSMKVVVRAERVNFYQLNYETYRDARGVTSYSPRRAAALRPRLQRAGEVIGRAGEDVSAIVAGGAPVRTHRAAGTLAPGARATLFATARPGSVVGLRLGPAGAFAGLDRDALFNVYYEGEATPSISVPAGDLFGYAWGDPATRSLLIGTAGGVNYLYLPMPFERAIRIELQSQRQSGPIAYEVEIKHSDRGLQPDEGRLYAVWRRENPTTIGKPYTMLDTAGRGHMVAASLQAQGSEPGGIPEFFEGDDVTTIDGVVRIRGTGSEDFFNGGWYDVPGRWDRRVSLPLSGSLDFKRHLARTGGYRLFVSDPYSFDRSIVQTIEHGPKGNNFVTDYVSVVFLYADRKPTGAAVLPAVAERTVQTPRQVVFTPGWTTPIEAFSWNNSTLAKAHDKIGGEELRHLQFRARDREVFGPHYVMFGCEMPVAGRYQVLVQAIAGPTQGRVQLFRNEVAQGPEADLYASERAKTAELPLGELDLEQGRNDVMIKVVGKDERSSGLGFDVYRLIFRKVD